MSYWADIKYNKLKYGRSYFRQSYCISSNPKWHWFVKYNVLLKKKEKIFPAKLMTPWCFSTIRYQFRDFKIQKVLLSSSKNWKVGRATAAPKQQWPGPPPSWESASTIFSFPETGQSHGGGHGGWSRSLSSGLSSPGWTPWARTLASVIKFPHLQNVGNNCCGAYRSWYKALQTVPSNSEHSVNAGHRCSQISVLSFMQ